MTSSEIDDRTAKALTAITTATHTTVEQYVYSLIVNDAA